jgi:hypothetical protein
MTKPLRPSPDSAYPTTPVDDHGRRRLTGRMIGAGAAVVVAGSALTLGLQAAIPDQVQAPVPATSGADAPTTSVVPAPPKPVRHDEGDDEADDEAGAPLTKVAPVRVAPAPAPTPAPAPVASSGGSGG